MNIFDFEEKIVKFNNLAATEDSFRSNIYQLINLIDELN